MKTPANPRPAAKTRAASGDPKNGGTPPRRPSQRGYNLVEIGIVLAVVGLILGASIVPLTELWRARAYNSVADEMRTLQDAVIGYALAHQTIRRNLNVQSGAPRDYILPAGRPYLPCPDVNGDGHEDRGGDIAISPAGAAPGDINNLGLIGPDDLRINTRIGGISTFNDLRTYGNCLASRGNLPWKTLGVKAADRWGNRYTYHVDDVFASATYGFSQDDIPDSFDPRIPVEQIGGEYNYARRDTNPPDAIGGSPQIYQNNTNTRRPLVICSTEANLCQPPAAGAPLPPLLAGEMADRDYNANRRSYRRGDIIEGVVFAIVSHGANGHGAVNHAANAASSNGATPRCNAPIYSAFSGGAAINISTDNAHLFHEAVNFPFPGPDYPVSTRYCPLITFDGANVINTGFIAAGPRTRGFGGNDQEFDDIVVWTQRSELLKILTQAQKLPAPYVDALRAYN